jgi:hypothetical protein
MEEVKKWLESEAPDFITGIALFAKYNKNKAILQWLTRVGEKRGMSKLVYELQKIVKNASSRKMAMPKPRRAVITIEKLKPDRIIIDTEGKIKREDLPEAILKLYDENVKNYKVMRGAHAAMFEAKNKNQRKKLRRQIAELDDKIASNWEVIDNCVLNQKLPDDNENITLGDDGKLIPRQVNTFRTYISRALAEPDNMDGDKRAKVQERITAMLNDGQSFDEETIEKLKSLGFNTQSNIPPQD